MSLLVRIAGLSRPPKRWRLRISGLIKEKGEAAQERVRSLGIGNGVRG